MTADSSSLQLSLYRDIPRTEWARLARGMDQPLTEQEIVQIRGLGDRLDVNEVRDVYLPLSRLLSAWAAGTRQIGSEVATFLGEDQPRIPFVVGVAGSVAVGKSTVARLLRELMSRWADTPRVELVTTDGFLYPNAELERRGIMSRKGFPESYDRRALVDFVTRVKSGEPEVRAPFYSHMKYDIMPDAAVVVRQPDVLIVEGLNVLQPPPAPNDVAVSDLFDFSIFVDAETAHIEQWFVNRFLKFREGAFANPESYFKVFQHLSDAEAIETARGIWREINLPNLTENVEPTKHRGTLVLRKGPEHSVESVLLRKL
ncbi:pantothenate kinase [Microbacterium sorbitolivorans]|uniref:Pantothenate kinase n=1 Tax=Microbacterium sorbitolivorans TaxID=1867410 RepID=A0A367XY10_9MICO|nr:type I pantothenate kinase [Microbacterium sorbitolivorans]RCK58498.1 type I pantothenate kinase [Microbacterium sorbitolivorans]GGF37018.1 pantothenate kinase [Microbacterium sorbitolivorans]